LSKGAWDAKVRPEAAKLAGGMGLELYDVELIRQSAGRFLRFYIDKPGGVTLDDCEKFHRAIQPRMEHVDYDYMEVSSPGADRPLKTEKDFARAEGLAVQLNLYKPINGKKQYLGDLVGLIDGMIVINVGETKPVEFERSQVALIKPYIAFDEDDLADEAPRAAANERNEP